MSPNVWSPQRLVTIACFAGYIMLRRKPTRIELKPDDIEEYDQYMKEKAQREASSNSATVQPAESSVRTDASKPSVAERIGHK